MPVTRMASANQKVINNTLLEKLEAKGLVLWLHQRLKHSTSSRVKVGWIPDNAFKISSGSGSLMMRDSIGNLLRQVTFIEMAD